MSSASTEEDSGKLPELNPCYGLPRFKEMVLVDHQADEGESKEPHDKEVEDIQNQTHVRINAYDFPIFFCYSKEKQSLRLSEEARTRLGRCKSILIWDEMNIEMGEDPLSFPAEDIANLEGLTIALSQQYEGALLPNCKTITVAHPRTKPWYGPMRAGSEQDRADKRNRVTSACSRLFCQIISQTEAVNVHDWDSIYFEAARIPEQNFRHTGTNRLESITFHLCPRLYTSKELTLRGDLVAGTHNVIENSELSWAKEELDSADQCITWMANQFSMKCSMEDVPKTTVTFKGFLDLVVTETADELEVDWRDRQISTVSPFKENMEKYNVLLREMLETTAPDWKDRVKVEFGRILTNEKNCPGCELSYYTGARSYLRRHYQG